MMLQTFSGRRPSQDEGELTGFLRLLQDRGVRRYLEVGARHGDTFHYLMTGLTVGSVGVAVDLPGALWGTDKSRRHLERAVADLKRQGYKASCLFGNSQTEATKRLIVGRGPYDAALLDGDHTYAGVSKDWQLYRNIAPIIAFHDIVGTGQAEKVHGNPVEVPRLWAEIKDSGLETVEFITPGSRMGIGVVCNSI
jgi:predicted O-methyltransferase YrrM